MVKPNITFIAVLLNVCEHSLNQAIVIYWLKLHVLSTEKEIKEKICGLAQTLCVQNSLQM